MRLVWVLCGGGVLVALVSGSVVWAVNRLRRRRARTLPRLRPVALTRPPDPPFTSAESRLYADVTAKLRRLRRDLIEGRITVDDHDRLARVVLSRLERVTPVPAHAAPALAAPRRYVVTRESVDELVAVAELVVTTQFGSASMLRRDLDVAPDVAETLLDALEERGVVGPPQQPRARDVLVSQDALPTVVTELWHEAITVPGVA